MGEEAFRPACHQLGCNQLRPAGHQLGRDQLWSAMGEKTKKIGRLEMDAGVEEDPKEDLKRLEVGVAVIKSQQLIHQHFT